MVDRGEQTVRIERAAGTAVWEGIQHALGSRGLPGRLARALQRIGPEASLFAEARRRTVHHNDFTRAFAVAEPLSIAGDDLYDGGISMLERVTLAQLLRFAKPRRLVEIGTYRGITTRLMLDNAPADARIWTIDLPEDVRSTDSLTHASDERLIRTREVGWSYKRHPAASRVQQVFGDSRDPDTWRVISKDVDFAFIDASHSYEAVKADTLRLLDHLTEDAVVLWHDYSTASTSGRGVGRYLREQMRGWLGLFLVAGTSLGIRIPENALRRQAARVREYFPAEDYDARRPRGAFPWLGI